MNKSGMTKLIIIFCLVFAACKTSKTVTQTRTIYDSLAIRERDSLSLEVLNMADRHQKEISDIKNTGVTFQPNCDTFIIDGRCNYDSIRAVISILRSSVKINKDGSIEAAGKLAGAYSNVSSLSKELDSLGATYTRLEKEHEDSLSELVKIREESHLETKSKPGGIFAAWWLFPVGLIAGFGAAWWLKNKKILS